MMSIVRRRVSINRARIREDFAPVTAAVGGFIGGRIPLASRLLSSAIVARLGRLPSLLCAFHAKIGTNQNGSGQKTTREGREADVCHAADT